MEREVVITGLGVVSAVGLGVEEFWTGLVEGLCGFKVLDRMDASGFPCQIGGQVRPFNVRDYLPRHYRKATKVMARDIELAVAASALAVADAGIVTRAHGEPEPTFAADRLGCQIGAGLIAAETAELSQALAHAVNDRGEFDLGLWGTVDGANGRKAGGGMDKLPPLWLLKYLPNMLACHVTIVHGAEGPSNTITCAEASALLSLGESARVIERGDADACFSGGAESKLNYMGMLRLDLAGRVAHVDEAVDGSSVVRPFALDAIGGVLGEAGAVLMLEERQSARARNQRVYARVAGFGAAQSFAGPVGTGVWQADSGPDTGLVDAIEAALGDAGIGSDAVDAIVPLGLGVPDLDQREADALAQVFGDRLGQVELITLTPGVGNCSAGHGGLMVAAATMALHRQALPARINAGSPRPGLRAGATGPREQKLENILVCASGLGGQSAALVLSAP